MTWKTVETVADLETLDNGETQEGYQDGRDNAPEPGGNRSRSYWHGWRMGMMDGHHIEIDQSTRILSHNYLKAQRK